MLANRRINSHAPSSPTLAIKFTSTYLNAWEERGTVRVGCLALQLRVLANLAKGSSSAKLDCVRRFASTVRVLMPKLNFFILLIRGKPSSTVLSCFHPHSLLKAEKGANCIIRSQTDKTSRHYNFMFTVNVFHFFCRFAKKCRTFHDLLMVCNKRFLGINIINRY